MSAPLFGQGMAIRRVVLRGCDVTLLRCILEAYEGLAHLHGDGEGQITLVCPLDRAAELDDWLHDVADELGIVSAPLPNVDA